VKVENRISVSNSQLCLTK